MSRVLITGGAGYIGTMLSTKLLELGHKVTVVDLLKYDKGSLNHLYFHENFNFICDDVRKKNLIKKLVKKNEVIIPLAALVGAPLCEKYKKDAKSTNFGTIKTLCELVTKKNKLIYLTTNSGYGIGEKNKYCDENSPLKPISLYGRTKCDGEDLVRKKIKNYVCFRLATVFGHSYRMRSDLLVNNFTFRKGVIEGLKYLIKKKFLIFIVTNQAGIAKGIFKEKDFFKLHIDLKKKLSKKKIYFNDVQYCPFHQNGILKKYKKKSNLRKPDNQMIKNIFKKFLIDKKRSLMIGDKITDKKCAEKSNLTFFYAKENFLDQVKKIV